MLDCVVELAIAVVAYNYDSLLNAIAKSRSQNLLKWWNIDIIRLDPMLFSCEETIGLMRLSSPFVLVFRLGFCIVF